MGRREMREHIFKLLFMGQFNTEAEMPDQLVYYFESLEQLSDEDQNYMKEKFNRIAEKIPEIDELLGEVSHGWKTARMNKVDLNVLRLAVYEVKYDEDVPTGVAINEAVELAKKFGGDDSYSFVNGILGKIARMPEE